MFVLSGPSGVGKGSVVRALLERDPSLVLSVSCTTRPPRDGEVDGVDYRFLSEEDFDANVASGAFLEHAEVFGRRYGTLAQPIEAATSSGRDVLLEIDVQGARSIRERLAERAVLIFLLPPSTEELARRLEERGTEDAADLALRMDRAQAELAERSWFDHEVVNDDLDAASGEVAAIIEEHRR